MEETLSSPALVPHGTEALPADVDAAIGWLPRFAIGGPAWPDNGLTVNENRELAATTEKARIVELVVSGLERRFR